MGLGLLGALQGAGQSMTQFGNALFAEETERQRQAELQKIRDTDYKRGRADQLTDQQTVFDRQDTVIAQGNTREDKNYTRDRADALADDLRQRTRQLADVAQARGWQVDDAKNTYTSFKVDDTGSVLGFNSEGSKVVGQLANMNPIVREANDAYQATLRRIDDLRAERGDSQYTDLFQSLDTFKSYLDAGFSSSAKNMGMNIDRPLSTLSGGAEENVALGNLLFSGKPNIVVGDRVISGDELLNYQDKFKQQFPSLYNGMFNR